MTRLLTTFVQKVMVMVMVMVLLIWWILRKDRDFKVSC